MCHSLHVTVNKCINWCFVHLFVIFVKEICNLLPSHFTLKLFADDAKLYSTATSINDADALQHCLDVICIWYDAQHLRLSPIKCTVMHIGPRRSNQTCTFPYVINCQVLLATDCVVDLGVMYDNYLSFSPHINKIVNNASRRANLILRCFTGDAKNARNENTRHKNVAPYCVHENTRHENAAPKIRGENEKSETWKCETWIYGKMNMRVRRMLKVMLTLWNWLNLN